MARKFDPDRITDLRRYRREREKAARAAASQKPGGPPPKPEAMLGGRRHAGLILGLAIVVLAAMAFLGHGF